MSERSKRISKLLTDQNSRSSYIRAKLGVLVPSQIRALRLKSDMPRQEDLAKEADTQQSRISMFETPGAANVTLETLARLAAVFKVGLIVKFVPFSEMLRWENAFSQDEFNVIRLNEDVDFLAPGVRPASYALQTVETSFMGDISLFLSSTAIDDPPEVERTLPSLPQDQGETFVNQFNDVQAVGNC